MKYRLKDEKMREWIDAHTDGDFSRVFHEQAEDRVKDGSLKVIVNCDEMTFEFSRDEIEEVHEFDPVGWNPWPEVTPPEEGAYYMLELPSDHMKLAAIWEGRGWIADDPGGGGYVVVNTGSEKGARFRTWGGAPALSKKLLLEVVTALESHPDAYDIDYLRKGRQIYVEGRLKTSKYTDKQGVEKYVTDVICENFQMLGRRDDGDSPF